MPLEHTVLHKVIIITGSSALRIIRGSVWRIHSHGGTTYTLFLYIHGANTQVEKNWHLHSQRYEFV